MTHLIDDKTVAKMGHPVVVVRSDVGHPPFPKWESLKNKSGKSGVFFEPENDRQLTSFHQQSTTNSPSKNHVLHPVFAKTHSKNAGSPALKKY
jgi:hypothetical protein